MADLRDVDIADVFKSKTLPSIYYRGHYVLFPIVARGEFGREIEMEKREQIHQLKVS